MEISNKTLAWLVVAAIAVSIFGTIISINKLNNSSGLTGYATSNTTGTAQIAISTQTILRFTVASVDFGSGQINTSGGYNNCTMSINDTTTGTIVKSSGCIGFNTTVGSGFTLQNAGTTQLNVTLNFSANAVGFINGTSPSFQFQVANNGTGNSCINGLAYTAWTEVALGTNYSICQNLSYIQNNSMLLGVKVSIPYDTSGSKSVSVLAQGTG